MPVIEHKTCFRWGSTNKIWSLVNLTWTECEIVYEIAGCLIWGQAGIPWKDTYVKWSECISPPVPPVPPVIEAIIQPAGVDATTLIQPWLIEPWNPYRNLEKKKRLIQLICKIKGEKFDETKEVKNIQIKVEDVSLVMKEILGIDLNITETKDGI